jgi:integrase
VDRSGVARVTVTDMRAVWVLGNASLKAKTLASYESIWRTLVLPRWGSTRLDRVTPLEVRGWVAGMTGARDKPLSASRKRQAYGLLASVLDAAVMDRRILTNPARAGATGRRGFLPKLSNVQRRPYLTHVEVDNLATESGSYRTLVLVLAYCGLRWGEATGLRVRDVDLMRRRLHVQQAAVEISGKITYGTPKTHQSREVSLPAFLYDDVVTATSGKGPDALVFTSPEGGPISISNFRSRTWLPALKRSGLIHMRIHDLRHVAASLAVESGANIKGVQQMLGHADAAMTLNIYSDLFDGHLPEVASRMDDARTRALEASVRPESATVIPLNAASGT